MPAPSTLVAVLAAVGPCTLSIGVNEVTGCKYKVPCCCVAVLVARSSAVTTGAMSISIAGAVVIY